MTSQVPQKCPCCNNPWSSGDFMARFCGECKVAPEDDSSKAMFSVDASVSPSNDFYLYANQKWIQDNPIPSGYPNWNTFLHLHTLSQERLKDLLQDLKIDETSSEDSRKLAAFYKAAMDEDAIETAGIKPMQPLLDACHETAQAATDKTKLATGLGNLLKKFGISAFFSVGASPDNHDSNHSIAQVAQGGLGLPDRDYYFDDDKQDKREAYKQHIAKMLTLLSDPTCTTTTPIPTEECVEKANQLYKLEEALAKSHMTKTDNRDPEATYNKMTIQDFATNVCKDQFDVDAYLRAATDQKELGEINIRNLSALEGMAEILSTIQPELLEDYLRWRSVKACASYMSKAFVMESFDFNERILSGTDEIKPRWKRAMAFTENALGEALGQVYCSKYFDESCKEKALFIVEQVRKALEERLKEVDWMKSDSTREQGLQKMNRFKVKIGYPDEWIDYSPFEIQSGDDFLSMIFASRQFDHMEEVKEMNAPTDKKKWFMTPQTINAYYHPSLNEIVFPAAILQAPMFDPKADMAVNFGAIGAVVGHEMTHGFDDKGRKFNFEGNMVDWWTKEDADEYEKRVEVMVEQANAYQVHGQSLKGKLTCGENIADLGGLRLALRALMAQPDFDMNDKIEGFDPIQRFFLGWANCWRQNITKERSLQLLTLDPHGPNPMRCNGPLSNMDEFHKAFGVNEDSPMYKAKDTRVDIW